MSKRNDEEHQAKILAHKEGERKEEQTKEIGLKSEWILTQKEEEFLSKDPNREKQERAGFNFANHSVM